MTTSFLKRGLSAFAALALAITLTPSFAFAATLSAPSDFSIESGKYTNDTTPTFTWTPSTGATWYEFLIDNGSWVGIGNTEEYTVWPLSNGWHTAYVRAHNNQNNTSTSAYITFEVDIKGPTVPAVSPSTAVEDQSVTFSVTPSGEAATTYCSLFVDNVDVGTMTKSGNTFTKKYTFNWDGTYTVYAKCMDGDGNATSGTTRTVTVSDIDDEDEDNDDETFVVPAVSPSSATEDESTTFTVTPYGTLDADRCDLYVNGSNVGTMSKNSSETFSRSYTFTNDGSYTVYAYCEDEDGDWTRGSSRTVTVDEEDDDNNDAPTVPAVSPSKATEDEEVTITVEPWSDERVSWCDLYVDGDNVGDMDRESDGTFSLDYTFKNDGSYTVYVTCTDASYDVTRGTSRTITVSEEDEDDTDGDLDVPTVSPSSADEDERTEFTVRPSGNYNITDCWLYVDGTLVTDMDEESTNVFVGDYTFRNSGSYSVYAYCQDSHDNAQIGDKRTVHVSDDNNDDDWSDDEDAERGTLIKTTCSAYATSQDPCRAVYYYGEDGMRHVFPNESVYFTWYNNFDDVEEVSENFMASLTIGRNVTYHPGSVLVKFQTSSSIYAVEAAHTLRRYTSSSLIASDYGSHWEDDVVTVPDSLFNNYTIGSIIDSSSDYDPDDEYDSVNDISDIL
jgi:hypothetical protein